MRPSGRLQPVQSRSGKCRRRPTPPLDGKPERHQVGRKRARGKLMGGGCARVALIRERDLLRRGGAREEDGGDACRWDAGSAYSARHVRGRTCAGHPAA
jgi:hypothetical protein